GAQERRAAALLALPRKLGEFVQASRLPQTRGEALLVALLLCGGAEPQPAAQIAPAPVPVDTQEQTPLEGEAILEPIPEEVAPEEALPEPELQPEPEPEK